MTCPSNCKGPGSDCLGLCLHRAQINTETMPKDCPAIFGTTPIAYAKGTENESRFARCKRAYRAYRFMGRYAAIKRFIKEWRAK